MSRACLLLRGIASGAVHGSAKGILEIPNGTPVRRQNRTEARQAEGREKDASHLEGGKAIL